MSNEMVLENVIISYPNLFEKKQINNSGDPKFSATLILPVDFDWGRANQVIEETIISAKASGRLSATAESGNIKLPWTDATPDGFPGQFLVRGYNDRHVQVGDQNVQPVMDQSLIFAGCIVHAYVGFYGYLNNGGGIGVGLNGIQIVKNTDVKRLDNIKDIKDVFKPIAGAPAASAPVNTGASAPVNTGAPVASSGPPQTISTGAPAASTPSNQPWNQ